MFKEVPLVNIDTQSLTIKIPALTSEDINKYTNYLTLRVEKNGQILEDRTSIINETLAFCGTTSKAEAQKVKDELIAEKTTVHDAKTEARIDKEIQDMEKIIALPQETTRQQL
jgi:hypothetical protein